MNVKFDFTGKIVVVVGAATGIGRATAVAFGKAGATVVVADINEEKGKETVKMITDGGSNGLFVKTDVTKDADAANLREQVIKTFGKVDVLFCNAGVSARQDRLGPPFTMVPVEEFERLMTLNVYGLIRISQAFLETFKEQKEGKIVATASISAYMPSVMMPQYSVSKISVINIAQTLAKELGPYNVNVNVLNPGFVYTPMYEVGGMYIKNKMPAGFADCKDSKDVMEKLASQSVMRRSQSPDDMANTVLFLSSDGAKEITGQVFNVDSGIIRR